MGGLFKGPDGKVSMMRVITAFTCLSIMSVFIAHNIVSMIKGGGFISLGASEAMLIAGVIGAKAAQSFSENKKTPEKFLENVMPVAEAE
jgi:hypothetical protein